MEPVKSDHMQEPEVTIKDHILRIQEWGKYFLSKWLVILICGMAGAILGLTYALLKKTKYVAELTFVLEDSKTNGLNAYAGIASQFGIDLGSTSGSGVFSGDNIMQFLKSRLMVEKALLSPLIQNDRVLSLADKYIEINELKDGWDEKADLKNLSFPLKIQRNDFTILQDSILNEMYKDIVKKYLVITKPDKKLSFISVKCISKDEFFSKAFTERLVKEAIDFYVQTKTKRSKASVGTLQAKADSLEALLNKTTFSAAVSKDMNLNPARSMAGVNTELVTRDKMILQTMYAEVVKNLELSRMAMTQETPIIQVVDIPLLPLEKLKVGKLKGIVIGGFLGGMLALIWLFARRLYREIMA